MPADCTTLILSCNVHVFGVVVFFAHRVACVDISWPPAVPATLRVPTVQNAGTITRQSQHQYRMELRLQWQFPLRTFRELSRIYRHRRRRRQPPTRRAVAVRV